MCVRAQSRRTRYNPMDGSPPGSSVREILQVKILDWVAISYSRGSSQHRDRTRVSFIAGRFFAVWAPGEARMILVTGKKSKLEFKCVLYFQGWFLTSKWIQALGCRQQDRCWGITCVCAFLWKPANNFSLARPSEEDCGSTGNLFTVIPPEVRPPCWVRLETTPRAFPPQPR